jgi:hypothetical protein
MSQRWIRALFVAAALYDGVLGLAVFSIPGPIFAYFGVTPPNHFAYVQFPALLLLIFAAMFIRVARDPAKNRELMLYGCGLKISYCALAFWYLVTTGIPSMWIPWAWADLVFLVLFLWAWASTGRSARAS